jgi:hypothetical protein
MKQDSNNAPALQMTLSAPISIAVVPRADQLVLRGVAYTDALPIYAEVRLPAVARAQLAAALAAAEAMPGARIDVQGT